MVIQSEACWVFWQGFPCQVWLCLNKLQEEGKAAVSESPGRWVRGQQQISLGTKRQSQTCIKGWLPSQNGDSERAASLWQDYTPEFYNIQDLPACSLMALPACWACGGFRLANVLWFWPVVSNSRNTRARSQDTRPQVPIWLHLTKGLFSEVLLHQMAPQYSCVSHLVLGSKPSPTSLGHHMLCQHCCAWVVSCGHYTFIARMLGP